jgi:hypothetical protein
VPSRELCGRVWSWHISVNTSVLICVRGEECGMVGSWLNYSGYRCLDTCRVERNLAGWSHGQICVNTSVLIYACG